MMPRSMSPSLSRLGALACTLASLGTLAACDLEDPEMFEEYDVDDVATTSLAITRNCIPEVCSGNTGELRGHSLGDIVMPAVGSWTSPPENQRGLRFSKAIAPDGKRIDLRVRGNKLYGFERNPIIIMKPRIGSMAATPLSESVAGAADYEGAELEGTKITLVDDNYRYELVLRDQRGYGSGLNYMVTPFFPIENWKIMFSRVSKTGGPATRYQYLCGDSGDGSSGMGRHAVLTNEIYDDYSIEPDDSYEHLNIGCIGSLIPKAAAFRMEQQTGANPGWDPSLAMRQSYMRMMAGDFCGRNISLTKPGVPLFWSTDELVPEVDETKYFYGCAIEEYEAVWGPNGAVCLSGDRLGSVYPRETIVNFCKWLTGRDIPECTSRHRQLPQAYGGYFRSSEPLEGQDVDECRAGGSSPADKGPVIKI